MARPMASVVLAVLLVLAGCSGVVPGAGSPSPTASPAPVPRESRTTATPLAGVPPGMTARGVADPLRLANAHRVVLADISHTVRFAETTRTENGTLVGRYESVVRVAPREGRVLRTVDVSGAAEFPLFRRARHAELYAENGTVHAVGTNDTAREYARFERTFSPSYRTLFLLLSSVETTVNGTVESGGTPLTRVRSTRLSSPRFLADAVTVGGFFYTGRVSDTGTIRNATLTALVDPRGLVREYRLTYVVVTDGRVLRVTRTVRYARLGATDVERPGWLGAAVNATG